MPSQRNELVCPYLIDDLCCADKEEKTYCPNDNLNCQIVLELIDKIDLLEKEIRRRDALQKQQDEIKRDFGEEGYAEYQKNGYYVKEDKDANSTK